MAKRKKRNAVTLLSLLLLLAALIGVYYWYGGKQAVTEDTGEDTDTIDLGKIDKEQLSSLHYVYDDADLTLVKDGDVWKSQAEPDRPIDQDHVSSMIGMIDDLSATRLITEAPENLADYGLDQPTSYLQGKLNDGTTVTLQVGDKVSTGDGFYALVNEDKKVYLIESFIGNGLQYTNLEMTAVPETLSIEAANINHISIDKRDGEDFELLYDDSGHRFDNSGSKLNSWYILKPYKEGYTADSSKVSTLQSNYTSFDYISCVDYSGTDLGKYGLDTPMAAIGLDYTVSRTEKLDTPEKDPATGNEITEKTVYDPKEYTLLIGNTDAQEDYYVKIDGSSAVYTMDADAINKMLTVDPFSIINPFVNIPNIDNVDKIDAGINGTTYTMTLQRTTSKNDKGEDEIKTAYTYNGSNVEEDVFKKLYQTIISVKFDAQIKEKVSTPQVDPYLTLTYYLNDNTTVTASYLPYNDSFYIIDTNGETRFFADKRLVEDIVKAVTEFKITE